ncbi:hypothetical protein SELMODRAFT_420951 [Selaginella moellendorffii]|uniref:Uncharacterized protein n=1 Tax=Selaginella moellendorffii TaxID=88036 RepID=D8SDN2_SELML|nr:hypothetical protein SELMODRAFT_420951 [Selaginella moellendorffii]
MPASTPTPPTPPPPPDPLRRSNRTRWPTERLIETMVSSRAAGTPTVPRTYGEAIGLTGSVLLACSNGSRDCFTAKERDTSGDWKKSLDGAFGFAVDAAAKRFNLRKEDLEAKISDPSYKNSRLTPEAWARQNYIRVVPKPDQGLEGTNTRLKALNSTLILQVTNQKEEIKNTKAQNDKLMKEQAEKIQELQKDSMEIVSLKEEITKLKERVAKLEEETSKLKERTSKLKEEFAALGRQLSAQGRELSALRQRLSALRLFERVLLRKLCEAAREKCVRLAREADVEIPLAADGKTNWDAFFNIPGQVFLFLFLCFLLSHVTFISFRVVALLNDAGLTVGLEYARSIPRRLLAGAYQVVELEEVFVDTVLELMPNEFRTKMENILVFVYPAAQASLQAAFDADALTE